MGTDQSLADLKAEILAELETKRPSTRTPNIKIGNLLNSRTKNLIRLSLFLIKSRPDDQTTKPLFHYLKALNKETFNKREFCTLIQEALNQ
jgi:hypothetical protein